MKNRERGAGLLTREEGKEEHLVAEKQSELAGDEVGSTEH
jgi:hypothetical protein